MFKKLAVTIGDPAGVGPDVIKKWAEAAPASLLKKVEVLGNKKFLDTLPALSRLILMAASMAGR